MNELACPGNDIVGYFVSSLLTDILDGAWLENLIREVGTDLIKKGQDDQQIALAFEQALEGAIARAGNHGRIVVAGDAESDNRAHHLSF